MTLNLAPELEQRLAAVAQSQGVSPAEYAEKVLDESLQDAERRQRAIALLQSWIDDGNEQEQRETYEYLTRVLDEDRPSDRKLFPSELKGITW